MTLISLEDPLSSEAWDALIDGTTTGVDALAVEDLDDLLGVSTELAKVSRRISGQYAEILASFAAQAFSGRARKESADHALSAADSLMRLAAASGDNAQVDLLGELRDLAKGAVEGRVNSRRRQSALRALRAWIPRFVATLDQADGERLLKLVEWDASAVPLMDELSTLRGIGPKRLGRLYAAGLHSIEVVATANPVDVASVTGLPTRLSEDVVSATRQYALDEQRRCLEHLRDRARRLRKVLGTVDGAREDLQELAAEAFREVELAFQQLETLDEP